MKQRLLRQLHEQRIVAIIRGIAGEGFDGLVGTLVESGIGIMEVTVDTPGVYD